MTRFETEEVCMLGQLAAFAGICVLITLVPGLDTALVTRAVLLRGRRAGVLAALGIVTGLYVHATAVALGVATLLEHSAAAFTVLRLCGAAYLGALGLTALWTSVRSRGPIMREPRYTVGVSQERTRVPAWLQVFHPESAFAQGLLSDLTNPKAFLFFVTFLPQFLTPGQPTILLALMLATIAVVIALAWLSLYSLALAQLAPLLYRPAVQRWLDCATGAIFVAFGVRLALETHP